MVNRCCVVGCSNFNSKDHPISMYRFPKVKLQANSEKKKLLQKRRDAWINAVKRKNLNTEKLHAFRICGKHFSEGEPSHYTEANHPDWVPHLHMGYNSSTEENEKRKSNRYHRQLNREVIVRNEIQKRQEEENSARELESPNMAAVEPVITLDSVQKDNDRLRKIIEELNLELSKAQLKEVAFISDDKKLTHYTGLPNLSLFRLLLEYIDSSLTRIAVQGINNFQKLLLTLMKLRLNTSFKGLGYRFNIRPRSASRVFKMVVLVLHHCFQNVVQWPDPTIVSKNMPACFKKEYGDRVKLIIDCFEIQSQKPALLKSQVQSYSQYKSGYTVKYLIGITPQGYIAYISDGWGGRVSDKVMTEQCDILQKLQPADIVLADQGFPSEEAIPEMQARILKPASTLNKDQLSPNEIEETQKLASVRIHVERIIGMLRNKFSIMKGPVQISMLNETYEDKTLMDYVVICCCILNNLCPSIIPNDCNTK